MEKYLYLTKHEWRQSWIHGGSIPINLASTYFRQDRGGIYTPDETLIHDSPVDLRALPGVQLNNVRNISMTNCSFGGVRVPDFKNASIYNDDGNILSFCNSADRKIMHRLGKVCCVKILDVEALRHIIDLQLGVEGSMRSCEYTDGHQRNHFLKSIEDGWQKEYRMFWPGRHNRKVTLPPAIAVPVTL